jgi:RNA polymerase sigma-70 factor (TIGR02957 family)
MPAAEDLLDELRPRAFAIAYRMLGTVSEAEDLVQEALLRLHRAQQEGERIESPRAYVSTVVTRLGIDQLRSARRRRETYVGDWLPEPLLTSDEDDPARHAEMADSLSLAFLVLLESLSPEQRAAFLLREVFDYPYDEIARIVGKSEANARQLVTRARRHVDEGRPRFEATREDHERLADRFFAAVEEGDVKGLETMLAEDVVLTGDGGGKVPALARALHGASRVARTLGNWGRFGQRLEGMSVRRAEVNRQPGAVIVDAEDRLIGVMSLDIAGGRVQGVRSVVNPEKLQHLGPVADLRALLRQASRERAAPSPEANPPPERAD